MHDYIVHTECGEFYRVRADNWMAACKVVEANGLIIEDMDRIGSIPVLNPEPTHYN